MAIAKGPRHRTVITKKPRSRSANVLPFRYFPRGRDAFEHVLRLPEVKGRTVLLPAYIGWGPVEGSGVYDPVTRTRARHAFYRLNGRLEIDVASVRRLVEANPGAVLLLIHYFGFRDVALGRIKKIAARHGCLVVEDFAHGLFTFFRDPVVDFDFAVFSLHKMLPYPNLTGGLLLSRDGTRAAGGKAYRGFYRYNLEAIARTRRANYEAALARLGRVKPPGLRILREDLGSAVPESFPVLLANREIRNLAHARMNERGFGLISLYHQLIDVIDETYRAERSVSDRITNLPIHQDASPADVRRMVDCLGEVLREMR